MHRTKIVLWLAGAAFVATLVPLIPSAQAMPAFSRRYETSCTTCHQYHYPRLNSFGRQFRDNGYQLPEGGEDSIRAMRTIEPGTPREGLSVFKEIPLSLRGQVFGVVRPDAHDEPTYDNAVFSFLIGGGSISKDVSYFFSWTPFPDPDVHQARVGVHNIASDSIGEGTLNVRAGALFLLDFQRPGHRFLSAGPTSATSVAVGQNKFTLDDTTLGVQVYGRPNWGPFHYELAVVTGDPGEEGRDRDSWKDVFGRVSYTFMHNTAHELRVGAFGYFGRSNMVNNFGGVELAQSDTFWMAGGDVEFDVGPVNLLAMAYTSNHSDPATHGNHVGFLAARGQGLVAVSEKIMAGARFEFVHSSDDTSLKRSELAPHLTYKLRTNVLASLVWRQNLREAAESSGVVALDAAF